MQIPPEEIKQEVSPTVNANLPGAAEDSSRMPPSSGNKETPSEQMRVSAIKKNSSPADTITSNNSMQSKSSERKSTATKSTPIGSETSPGSEML